MHLPKQLFTPWILFFKPKVLAFNFEFLLQGLITFICLVGLSFKLFNLFIHSFCLPLLGLMPCPVLYRAKLALERVPRFLLIKWYAFDTLVNLVKLTLGLLGV
jgi:hypothetical protein